MARDELYDVEEKFVNYLEECRSLSSYAFSVFDIEEYATIAKNFETALKMLTGLKVEYQYLKKESDDDHCVIELIFWKKIEEKLRILMKL